MTHRTGSDDRVCADLERGCEQALAEIDDDVGLDQAEMRAAAVDLPRPVKRLYADPAQKVVHAARVLWVVELHHGRGAGDMAPVVADDLEIAHIPADRVLQLGLEPIARENL